MKQTKQRKLMEINCGINASRVQGHNAWAKPVLETARVGAKFAFQLELFQTMP